MGWGPLPGAPPRSAITTWLREYVRACVTIDPRSLAVFRVIAGVLIVADIVLRSERFWYFYTEEGVVPLWLAQAGTPDLSVSVFYLTTDPRMTAVLFVVYGLVGLQLLIGYKTRFATVLAFLMVISLDHRNVYILSYADTLFRLLLFWAIFLPLGERWSVDAALADRPARHEFVGLAGLMILLQMIFMYHVNGLHKTVSPLWRSGYATPLILGMDEITFLLGETMRTVPSLLRVGGLVWFALLLASPLLILLRGRFRTGYVALLFGGHVSFMLTVRIGAFAYVAIMGLVLFLQASFWNDLDALARRLDLPTSIPPGWRTNLIGAAGRFPRIGLPRGFRETVNPGVYSVVLVVVVAGMVLLSVSMVLSITGTIEDDPEPLEPVETVAKAFGVDQPTWTVFAPNPRTTDRYYVFIAHTMDGDRLDVYNHRDATFDRPYKALQQQYQTYRERFYMNSVRRGHARGEVTRVHADYVCEQYREHHGVELRYIYMFHIREIVTIETLNDPDNRDRKALRFNAHACDGGHAPDFEPRSIDLNDPP